MKQFKAKVAKREDVTHDLFKLWLDLRDERKNFSFKAGQYCTIGMNGIWRPYSIVSAPHEERIELFIGLVPRPQGNLTPLLYELKQGDTLDVLPKAKGIFTLDPRYSNQVMVATVTGIVPFMSMLRSNCVYPKAFDYRFFVLQGASYHDEFGYDTELELFKRAGWDMEYIPTVSRPNEDRNKEWGRQTGRANEVLEEYLRRWNLFPRNTVVYACGHPGMIENVKTRLAPKGWTDKNKVREERYWK